MGRAPVDAVNAGGAELQALHAAVTRFVVLCRERGEKVERVIGTLKAAMGASLQGRGREGCRRDQSSPDRVVLDAYYTSAR